MYPVDVSACDGSLDHHSVVSWPRHSMHERMARRGRAPDETSSISGSGEARAALDFGAGAAAAAGVSSRVRFVDATAPAPPPPPPPPSLFAADTFRAEPSPPVVDECSFTAFDTALAAADAACAAVNGASASGGATAGPGAAAGAAGATVGAVFGCINAGATATSFPWHTRHKARPTSEAAVSHRKLVSENQSSPSGDGDAVFGHFFDAHVIAPDGEFESAASDDIVEEGSPGCEISTPRSFDLLGRGCFQVRFPL